MDTLGDDLGVLVGSIFRGLGGSSLECQSVSLVLHALRCDKSLDLGGFGVWLAAALGCNFSSNDELSDVILLAQTKELSDLGSSLGTKSLWVDNVGEKKNSDSDREAERETAIDQRE